MPQSQFFFQFVLLCFAFFNTGSLRVVLVGLELVYQADLKLTDIHLSSASQVLKKANI